MPRPISFSKACLVVGISLIGFELYRKQSKVVIMNQKGTMD